jgi:hypothetical protein
LWSPVTTSAVNQTSKVPFGRSSGSLTAPAAAASAIVCGSTRVTI